LKMSCIRSQRRAEVLSSVRFNLATGILLSYWRPDCGSLPVSPPSLTAGYHISEQTSERRSVINRLRSHRVIGRVGYLASCSLASRLTGWVCGLVELPTCLRHAPFREMPTVLLATRGTTEAASF